MGAAGAYPFILSAPAGSRLAAHARPATRTSQNVACQYHHYTVTFTPSFHLRGILHTFIPPPLGVLESVCACGRKQCSPQHGVGWGRTHEDVHSVYTYRTCYITRYITHNLVHGEIYYILGYITISMLHYTLYRKNPVLCNTCYILCYIAHSLVYSTIYNTKKTI